MCYTGKLNERDLTNHGANISWNILYKDNQFVSIIRVSILLLSIKKVNILPAITWCLPLIAKDVLKQLYYQLVLEEVFHGRNWSLQCLQVEKAGTKWNKTNVCYFSLTLSDFNFQNAITFWMKPSIKVKISNSTFCCSMLSDQNQFLLMFTNLPGYQVNCVVTKDIIPCCCANEDVLSCKFSFNIRNPERHPWWNTDNYWFFLFRYRWNTKFCFIRDILDRTCYKQWSKSYSQKSKELVVESELICFNCFMFCSRTL